MIKIAVCDDELAVCRQLKDIVAQTLSGRGEGFQISCFTRAQELLEDSSLYSLVFLDIRMPDLDGVSLARKIRGKDPDCAIIFTTILQEYMLDAFEVGAIDYLCKPVDTARLEKALDRALRMLQRIPSKNIVIHSSGRYRPVKMNTIRYCEVINRKIYLHTTDGVFEFYGRLEEIEKQVDDRFIKCHRSYLVNLDFLAEYADGEILLENGDRVPVARPRRKDLAGLLLRYMKREDCL